MASSNASMSNYNYVDSPDSNLVCCICRTPFVDPTSIRTCSHTFCYECIVCALEHSSQCPVDRSQLVLEDLAPASSIVRNLVDELIVECPQRLAGCDYTCQRQLLASHVRDSCQYTLVSCSEANCNEFVPRKDLGTGGHDCEHRIVTCDTCGGGVKFTELESHNSDCSSKTIACKFCLSIVNSSELKKHNSTCPDFVIPCTHDNNGCPWKGPRGALQSAHIPTCPYESIKGFFSINSARISTLSEENTVLKLKVEALEGMVRTLKREMQSVKAALGPWYRIDAVHSPAPTRATISTEDFLDLPRTALGPPPPSWPNLPAEARRSPPTGGMFDIRNPIYNSPPDIDYLAPYFPPEAEASGSMTGQRPMAQAPAGGHPFSRTTVHTSVAPINLSTNLEGSLGSLRESIVSLSASLDSVARRHDIALTNESLRLNEETRSLRSQMNGLRMQVHGIMMDRNAQVTGRIGDEGGYVHPGYLYGHPTATTPFTKL